jgi:hypothetical protein
MFVPLAVQEVTDKRFRCRTLNVKTRAREARVVFSYRLAAGASKTTKLGERAGWEHSTNTVLDV